MSKEYTVAVGLPAFLDVVLNDDGTGRVVNFWIDTSEIDRDWDEFTVSDENGVAHSPDYEAVRAIVSDWSPRSGVDGSI